MNDCSETNNATMIEIKEDSSTVLNAEYHPAKANAKKHLDERANVKKHLDESDKMIKKLQNENSRHD